MDGFEAVSTLLVVAYFRILVLHGQHVENARLQVQAIGVES
jgi:hypothetical protein